MGGISRFAMERVQLLGILTMLIMVFLLMWDTVLFEYGLLGTLCSRLRLIFVVLPLYAVLVLGARVIAIVGVTRKVALCIEANPRHHTTQLGSCGQGQQSSKPVG